VKKPPRAWRMKVNGEHNPWFTDTLAEERAYDYEVDPEAADHVWGGNLRTASDAQVLRGKWTVEDFEVPMVQDPDSREPRLVPKWAGPYQGMDFGFATDPFAAVRCWIWEDVLYVEREAYGLGIEIDNAVSFTLDKIPGFARYRARADSSRPDSISYLRRHGLRRLRAAKKGPNSVEDGIAFLRRFKKIVIHTRCTHAKDEAKLYSYKVDKNSGDVLAEVVDKHNHVIDSIRYALEPIMKKRKKQSFSHVGTGDDARPVCRVCHSLLPDDGACVQCGWDEHEEVEAAEPVEVSTVALVEPSEELPVLRAERNGNGHSNGNGNGHAPKRRSLLRGLNDN
jgi:phage terminase large subunit